MSNVSYFVNSSLGCCRNHHEILLVDPHDFPLAYSFNRKQNYLVLPDTYIHIYVIYILFYLYFRFIFYIYITDLYFSFVKYKNWICWAWCCTPLISALVRQKQVGVRESEDSLIYRVKIVFQQNSETKIPKNKELNQIAMLDRGGQWNTIKWASGVFLILFNKNTFKACWKYYAAIEGMPLISAYIFDR